MSTPRRTKRASFRDPTFFQPRQPQLGTGELSPNKRGGLNSVDTCPWIRGDEIYYPKGDYFQAAAHQAAAHRHVSSLPSMASPLSACSSVQSCTPQQQQQMTPRVQNTTGAPQVALVEREAFMRPPHWLREATNPPVEDKFSSQVFSFRRSSPIPVSPLTWEPLTYLCQDKSRFNSTRSEDSSILGGHGQREVVPSGYYYSPTHYVVHRDTKLTVPEIISTESPLSFISRPVRPLAGKVTSKHWKPPPPQQRVLTLSDQQVGPMNVLYDEHRQRLETQGLLQEANERLILAGLEPLETVRFASDETLFHILQQLGFSPAERIAILSSLRRLPESSRF